MSGPKKSTALSRLDLFLYGALAFPLASAGLPLYIHAPDWYATHHGISLSALGGALLLLRFLDALQDPLIGYASARWEKYRLPVMLVAAVVMAVGFFGLFHPMTQGKLAWFFITMLLATTAFSTLTINLNTLGSAWSHDAHQKTRITSWREAIGLFGLMLAVMAPSVLQKNLSADTAFHVFSLAILGLLTIGMVIFMIWHRRHLAVASDRQAKPQGLIHAFRHFPKAIKTFFTVYAVSILSSSIPAILVLFFIRDGLQDEANTGLFLLLYFLSGIVCMPLWLYLSKKQGAVNAWRWAMLLAVVSFVWAFFLAPGDSMAYGAICILSGIAFGAELSLPPAILSSLLEREGEAHRAPVHFAVLTFFSKIGLALAAALTFPLLDVLGFKAGAANNPAALWGLSFCYALLPCLLKLLSVVILSCGMKTLKLPVN